MEIAGTTLKAGVGESLAATGLVFVFGLAVDLKALIERDTEMYGRIIGEANISLN